jgi:hypothetical protein
MFFRNRELTIFGGLEPAKPRIRECVKFGDHDSVKAWSREHAEARNLELAMARTSKKQRPIRESVEGLVRESRVKTFTNRRRSKVKVVAPKSSGFECELVADL